MGIIGDAAGALAGIGGAIFGGISASKAMKKVKANLESQRAANEDWYNRNYNEDVTQRADAQRMWTRAMEAVRQQNRQAAGAQAVSGGTEESAAAAREAGNAAMADVASRIAAAGSDRRDAVDRQYRAQSASLDAQLNNMELNRANAVQQAAAGLSAAAGGLGGSLQDYVDDRKG